MIFSALAGDPFANGAPQAYYMQGLVVIKVWRNTCTEITVVVVIDRYYALSGGACVVLLPLTLLENPPRQDLQGKRRLTSHCFTIVLVALQTHRSVLSLD